MKLRLQISRPCIRYLCAMNGVILMIVHWRAMSDVPRGGVPSMAIWTTVAVFWICLLVDICPSAQRENSINVVYVILSVCWAALLSPWHVQSEFATQMSFFVLSLGRLPAIGIATTPALVGACNFLPIVVLVLRNVTGSVPANGAFAAEISAFVATMCAAVALHLGLHYRATRSLQYQRMASDLNAASSLLHLTCDSVASSKTSMFFSGA